MRLVQGFSAEQKLAGATGGTVTPFRNSPTSTSSKENHEDSHGTWHHSDNDCGRGVLSPTALKGAGSGGEPVAMTKAPLRAAAVEDHHFTPSRFLKY